MDENVHATYVLKISCQENDKIILFNEASLKDCRNKLNIRKACNLKYKEIILPDSVNNVSGYHRNCKKLFTSINKKSVEAYNRKNGSSEENLNTGK